MHNSHTLTHAHTHNLAKLEIEMRRDYYYYFDRIYFSLLFAVCSALLCSQFDSLHFFSTLFVGMSMGSIQPSVREMEIGNSVYAYIYVSYSIFVVCAVWHLCALERFGCDKTDSGENY